MSSVRDQRWEALRALERAFDEPASTSNYWLGKAKVHALLYAADQERIANMLRVKTATYADGSAMFPTKAIDLEVAREILRGLGI